VKVIDTFVPSIMISAQYNPDIQESPHCILWSDEVEQGQTPLARLITDSGYN